MESELWATIRRLHTLDGLSKTAIARRLRITRWSVRRALSSPLGPPPDRPRPPTTQSVLQPHTTYIAERIQQFPDLPAAKLFLEIQTRGYTGSYTTLKRHLRPLRQKNAAFLRLETDPGEFAQVDWAHCGTIQVGNAKRLLSCFVMVLSYSRMIYLEFTLSQSLADFLAAHVRAFEFFGGVPAKINYDNLKTVVLCRVGRDVRFHPRFHSFAGFYVFDPVPCSPRAAWQKGKVESGIKYIRSSFLAGRDIRSFADLQRDAVLWRDTIANIRTHGTTHQRPIDRFDLDKSRLHPLPGPDFDTALIRPVTVTRQALVSFDANRYSVPFDFAGKDLALRATTHLLELIGDEGRVVATHTRCYEKHRVIENPAHFEGLLAQRKKASATKRGEAFLALAPECASYLSGLVQAELHTPDHVDRIFDLIHRYGKAEVLSAILRALSFKAFGAHYIERIVHQARVARSLPDPTPIQLAKKPEWSRLAVEQTDLALYDELFENLRHD